MSIATDQFVVSARSRSRSTGIVGLASRALLMAALSAQVVACAATERHGFEFAEYFTDQGDLRVADAACNGRSEEVSQLIESGVSVNTAGRHGYTPLHVAVRCESRPGVIALLDNGADPNAKTDSGANAVWFAAGMENQEILTLLIDHGGDIHVMAGSSQTPLIRSLSPSISTANFELLLRRGVNVNQADDLGSTAARAAIAYGRLDLLIRLLEADYSYDLLAVAVSAENRAVSSDRLAELSRVREMLSDRGVVWPLPTKLDYEGRVKYLKANPKYALAHPESWPIGHELRPSPSVEVH